MSTQSSERTAKLRVAEARSRDVGRKIARIDRETMKKLDVEVGDFIEVIGLKGREILKVWPAYPEDEGTGIIRVDGTVRRNLGVAPGDYITVKPIRVDPAKRVVVAPVSGMSRLSLIPSI